ncbi:MAG: signal peptidase I [Armatimonadetes bacterium]|nr:signal peptidase I [Armatimonadota bacterium]
MLGKLRTGSLVLLLLIALALTPFRPLKISGRSMEPTLRNGETYLLDHLYWRLGGVRRGDIVVVRHEEDKWVKRLIGMPNDELQLLYSGRGWISRIDNLTVSPADRREHPAIRVRKVSADEIFVIGDNLNRSTDSTNQEAGSFRFEDIIGVVRRFNLQREFPFRTHE